MAKSRAEQVLERKRKEWTLGHVSTETEEKIVDISDPEVIKQREERAERRGRRKEKVLIDLLSTTQGREFIADFLVACDVLGDPFVQNSADGTAKNIGLQNAGRWWLKQIFDICPDKYPKMLKEAKERDED